MLEEAVWLKLHVKSYPPGPIRAAHSTCPLKPTQLHLLPSFESPIYIGKLLFPVKLFLNDSCNFFFSWIPKQWIFSPVIIPDLYLNYSSLFLLKLFQLQNWNENQALLWELFKTYAASLKILFFSIHFPNHSFLGQHYLNDFSLILTFISDILITKFFHQVVFQIKTVHFVFSCISKFLSKDFVGPFITTNRNFTLTFCECKYTFFLL